MYALALAHAARALEAHGLCARGFGGVRGGYGYAFFAGDEPHGAEDAAIWAWLNNGLETDIVGLVSGALLSGCGVVGKIYALVLVVL